jgi:hypothetical protein
MKFGLASGSAYRGVRRDRQALHVRRAQGLTRKATGASKSPTVTCTAPAAAITVHAGAYTQKIQALLGYWDA